MDDYFYKKNSSYLQISHKSFSAINILIEASLHYQIASDVVSLVIYFFHLPLSLQLYLSIIAMIRLFCQNAGMGIRLQRSYDR